MAKKPELDFDDEPGRRTLEFEKQIQRPAGEEYDAFWETAWQEGIGVGEHWDMAQPHKALVHLITTGRIDVKGKDAVVPGCGRGYDPIALAEAGASVEGLEISSTAVAEAQSYLRQYNTERGTDTDVTYTAVDFFEHRQVYDFGFDYTFLCAIHPDVHEKWGEKWAEILKPGGELLVILFPIMPEKTDGPPWHVDAAIVTEALGDRFELVFDEPVPDALSEGRRAGYEGMMLWKRK